jgi:hypothetical protein
VRKGPGIHVDRAEVSFKLAALPEDEALLAVAQRFEEQTGYRLVVGV